MTKITKQESLYIDDILYKVGSKLYINNNTIFKITVEDKENDTGYIYIYTKDDMFTFRFSRKIESLIDTPTKYYK